MLPLMDGHETENDDLSIRRPFKHLEMIFQSSSNLDNKRKKEEKRTKETVVMKGESTSESKKLKMLNVEGYSGRVGPKIKTKSTRSQQLDDNEETSFEINIRGSPKTSQGIPLRNFVFFSVDSFVVVHSNKQTTLKLKGEDSKQLCSLRDIKSIDIIPKDPLVYYDISENLRSIENLPHVYPLLCIKMNQTVKFDCVYSLIGKSKEIKAINHLSGENEYKEALKSGIHIKPLLILQSTNKAPEIQISSEMYKSDFKNQGGILQLFVLHLMLCLILAIFGVIYSPYSCVCQTSGCGKSRLMIEVAEYVISLIIRCKDCQGKLKSPAIDMIFDCCKRLPPLDLKSGFQRNQADIDNFRVNELAALFRNWVKCIRFAYNSKSFKEFIDLEEYGDYDLSTPKGRINFALDSFMNDNDTIWDSMDRKVGSLGKVPDCGPLIMLGFDESRELCTNGGYVLRMIRRALRECVDIRVVGIFTDTTCSILNFSLKFQSDDSARGFTPIYAGLSSHAEAIARKFGTLFPPFVVRFQDTLDTKYESYVITNFYGIMSKRNYRVAEDYANAKRFLLLGRPVWKDYLTTENTALREIVNGAFGKLTHLLFSENLETAKLSADAAICIIASRCPFAIPAYSPFADKLVSSHMAYCFEVEMDRSGPNLTYLSEPAIACGASLAMKNFEKQICELAFPFLKRFLPSAGMRGEFAFVCLAIQAFDLASEYNPTALVPLEDFLMKLFGYSRPNIRVVRQSPRLHRAQNETDRARRFVNLTQFKKVEVKNKQLTSEYFIHCAARGLGLIMGDCNYGYDVLIPIVCGDNSFSAIFVELKNRKDTCNTLNSQLEDTRENAFIDLDGDAYENFKNNAVFILWEMFQGKKMNVELELLHPHIMTLFCRDTYHVTGVLAIENENETSTPFEQMIWKLLEHSASTNDLYLMEELKILHKIRAEREYNNSTDIAQDIDERLGKYYETLGDEYIIKGDVSKKPQDPRTTDLPSYANVEKFYYDFLNI